MPEITQSEAERLAGPLLQSPLRHLKVAMEEHRDFRCELATGNKIMRVVYTPPLHGNNEKLSFEIEGNPRGE